MSQPTLKERMFQGIVDLQRVVREDKHMDWDTMVDMLRQIQILEFNLLRELNKSERNKEAKQYK